MGNVRRFSIISNINAWQNLCLIGDPVTYTNWISHHNDNFVSHHLEDCIALIPYMGGVWDDIPCGGQGWYGEDVGEKHPGFCEYSKNLNVISYFAFLFGSTKVLT